MTIFSRAREIIVSPKVTWQVIKGELVDVKQLLINYAAPLALIPAVCTLIGFTLVGIRISEGGAMRAPFMPALMGGVVGYLLHLGGILLAAWAIKFLAPTFGSKSDLPSALKIVVYAMTPAWLVGVFSLVPGLGILSLLGFYGIYLLVLGLPVVLETPPNKVVWYTISILAVGFVINLVLSVIIIGTLYGPMLMRMMAG